MRRRVWLGLWIALTSARAVAGAEPLTATEGLWLLAGRPVLAFAQAQGLPLDIVVRLEDSPGETPLGTAFSEGRCQLVLSMRGNPEAQATLDRMDADLVGPVIEALTAHELAHCWRHLQHSWGTLPPGMKSDIDFSLVSDEQAALLQAMWTARQEEGYADLVGLAWTLQHHPARYDEVHAWFVRLRARQPIPSGPHDTRAWIRLSENMGAFEPSASVFDQATPLWTTGLTAAW
jgi:hypothetical protein